MKCIKILLLFFITSIFALSNVYSQKFISQNDAELTAQKWMRKLGKDSLTEKIIRHTIKNKLLYHIDYEDYSSVIVSSKKGVIPIIAYSRNRSLLEENLTLLEKEWLECVNDYIDFHSEDSLETLNSSLNSDYSQSSTTKALKSTSVSSLFESTQSSRWAYWGPYVKELPYQSGTNICVPLAMAQIIKYYKYPIQGINNHSYTWYDQGVGVVLSVDYSKQWYNYNNMPFRLTYCGRGTSMCNDGKWDLIPGTTDDQISEVSRLIYHCGVAVEMLWQGNNPPSYVSGTYGSTNKFASALFQYFDYAQGWSYYDNIRIANNNAGFKQTLRNELQNRRPVLFSYYSPGHAVVIDGYENDNFFHFSCGWGGDGDAFYYLFDLDNDGIHDQVSHHDSYDAVIGIRPNCPIDPNLTIQNITVQTIESKTYSAINSVNLNNVLILGNGASGGRVGISANEVNLNSGFELQTGACIFISPIGCFQP